MTDRQLKNKSRLIPRKGFTLAEVLITLTVIGIIAALTLPALITNIQDRQNKVIWRKAYSDFAAATARLIQDKGGTLKGNYGSYTAYLPYLSYIKSCTTGASAGICWHEAAKWFRLSGEAIQDGWYDQNKPAVVMNNGTLVYFLEADSECDMPVGTSGYFACGRIFIDVNGFKGPNTIGKDIFSLWILEDRILPMGIPNDRDYYTPCIQPPAAGWTSGLNHGNGCSALYLKQ